MRLSRCTAKSRAAVVRVAGHFAGYFSDEYFLPATCGCEQRSYLPKLHFHSRHLLLVLEHGAFCHFGGPEFRTDPGVHGARMRRIAA